jgi:hypothetical protein
MFGIEIEIQERSCKGGDVEWDSESGLIFQNLQSVEIWCRSTADMMRCNGTKMDEDDVSKKRSEKEVRRKLYTDLSECTVIKTV